MRCATFGDSYVTHLQKFTRGRLSRHGCHRFFGVPGMTTENKFQSKFEELLDYEPRYVFLILGGNDINARTDPNLVYKRIKWVVDELYKNGVEGVFVASIIARGQFPSWTGLRFETFKKIRRAVNRKLKNTLNNRFVEVDKRLQYPRHYDQDMIHPGIREGGLKVLRHYVMKAFGKVKKC